MDNEIRHFTNENTTRWKNTVNDVSNGAAAGGLAILPSAGTGLKNRIYSILLTASATETITLNDGFGVFYCVAGVPIHVDYGFHGRLQTTAATAITATTAGACNVGALVQYSKE